MGGNGWRDSLPWAATAHFPFVRFAMGGNGLRDSLPWAAKLVDSGLAFRHNSANGGVYPITSGRRWPKNRDERAVTTNNSSQDPGAYRSAFKFLGLIIGLALGSGLVVLFLGLGK